MAEKPQKDGEKTLKPKEKPDLVKDFWRERTKLKLHLSDGTIIEGQIKQFDQYNLQITTDTGRSYWIPKHAVVFAEML